MINPPITSSNSQSSAKGTSTTQANGMPDAQTIESFGALLAQQMDESEASTSSAIALSPAIAIDTEATAGYANSKADQDETLVTTGISGDPATLITMLQLPLTGNITSDIDTEATAGYANSKADQDETLVTTGISGDPATLITMLQLPLTGNITSDIDTEATAGYAKLTSKADQDNTLATTDIPSNPAGALMAMLQLSQEIKTPAIKDATNSTTTAVHTMTTGKAASYQPTVSIDATQARTKFDPVIADNQFVRSTGLDAANSAVLTNSQPHTFPPTPDVTPSIAASSAMPNMQAIGKPVDIMQTISTPLNNSGWADDFSQKITWMSTQKNQVAELHLNPPDLGPLNVVLKISDNQATALFTSPHSAVRDAVENALPKLRETLADNGITLGNTTVSDQPPRDRDMKRFMNHGSGTTAKRDGSSEMNLLTVAAQVAPARRHNGMVDTFA